MKHWIFQLLDGALRFYKLSFSIVFESLGYRCRFEPTCSEYAVTALKIHGPVAGTWLALGRICRCHPWGKGGIDPCPSLRKQ